MRRHSLSWWLVACRHVWALPEAEVRSRLVRELQRKGLSPSALSPSTAPSRWDKEAKWEPQGEGEGEVKELREACRELQEQLEEAHERTFEAEKSERKQFTAAAAAAAECRPPQRPREDGIPHPLQELILLLPWVCDGYCCCCCCLGTQQASAGLDPITRAVQRAHSSTVALTASTLTCSG
jgi:hypothetical protein